MSLAHEYEQPPFPPHAPYQPPMPPKPKNKLKLPLLILAGLLFGAVIGGTIGASAVPEPVEIVKEVEKRVEVPVAQTPASCLKAIQHAEEVMNSSARVVGIFGQILDAVKILDAAAIGRLNPKIDDETAILTDVKPKYHAARDSCQASR